MSIFSPTTYYIDIEELQDTNKDKPYSKSIPWTIYLSEDKSTINIELIGRLKTKITNKPGILFLFDNGPKTFAKYRSHELHNFFFGNGLKGCKKINPNECIYTDSIRTDGEIIFNTFGQQKVKYASYVICHGTIFTLKNPMELKIIR